jgi:hypothetical protein
MEYLDGETLQARLGRGLLSLTDMLRIGGEVSEAVGAAARASSIVISSPATSC